jgi:hypothetical protein
MAQDPAQRVYLTHEPAPPAGAVSTWVSRQEVHPSDGPWADGLDLTVATIRNDTEPAIGGPFEMGLERWFGLSFWLPDDDPPGASFTWPEDQLLTMATLAGGAVVNLSLLVGSVDPRMLMVVLNAPGLTDNKELVPLLQLSLADGATYAASYNRWHRLVLGVKYSDQGTLDDSPGWIEIWLDGVNVYPRRSRPTCSTGQTAAWIELGYTIGYPVTLRGGASATTLFYAGPSIGLTRSDVDSVP